MILKKGTKVLVESRRRGSYRGILGEDVDIDKFNSGKEDYFVEVFAAQIVFGVSEDWQIGESVPCRSGLNKIKVIGE